MPRKLSWISRESRRSSNLTQDDDGSSKRITSLRAANEHSITLNEVHESASTGDDEIRHKKWKTPGLRLANALRKRRSLKADQMKAADIIRESLEHSQITIPVSGSEIFFEEWPDSPDFERCRSTPEYPSPKTRSRRDESRREMIAETNRPSIHYDDMRPDNSKETTVGSFYLEILQGSGIPRPDLLKDSSAFCIAVCGKHAFKTDVIAQDANPMWLSGMRRACVFPLYYAYSNVAIGVFSKSDFPNGKDAFIGRVVLDMTKLRPGSTYDVTLPLRQSSRVYSREPRGAIRVRFHLQWESEQKALLSYLPRQLPQFQPHEAVTVRCTDNKAFQNVARVVHGSDMPGRFSLKLLQATIRELNFTRIHVLRYLPKREFRSLMTWRYPIISAFVFSAWMHGVVTGTCRYVPGHLVTFLLLHIWKNYALYSIDGKCDGGFAAPTWEEMLMSVLFGGKRQCIQPLEMIRSDPENSKTEKPTMDTSCENIYPLQEIATALRKGVEQTFNDKHINDKHNLVSDVIAFAGKDAVDFLVENKFAMSRAEAVEIGNRLCDELKLFEHVSRQYDFQDTDLLYVFLENECTFRTHKPWFKQLFRRIGFKNDASRAESHWEFPFATGTDHPRFTIKDALSRNRSKDTWNTRQVAEPSEAEELSGELEITPDAHKMDSTSRILWNLLLSSRKKREDSSKILDTLRIIENLDIPENCDDDTVMSGSCRNVEIMLPEETEEDHLLPGKTGEPDDLVIQVLPKPPFQDMNSALKRDKKIEDAVLENMHNTHELFANLFHDKPYRLGRVDVTQRTESKSFWAKPSKRRRLISRPNAKKATQTSSTKGSGRETGNNTEEISTYQKDECDKLLQLSKYSHSNTLVSKLCGIIQPIIEMVQLYLSIFRALFNIFTWRDPFYTFWVVIIGTVLVVFLHLFPWRIGFGVAGIVFVGPQNWLVRLICERDPDYKERDLNLKVKRRRGGNESEDANPAFFSSYTPDNRPTADATDVTEYKEVAVPDTPLTYRRFYDWPPESEYARVWKSPPPETHLSVEHILQDENDNLEVCYSSFRDDESGRTSHGWKNKRLRGLRSRRLRTAKHASRVVKVAFHRRKRPALL